MKTTDTSNSEALIVKPIPIYMVAGIYLININYQKRVYTSKVLKI